MKESQAAAQQALDSIPEIQQIILVAVNKTENAELSLLDSKQNADEALSTAIQANELAKQASQSAQNIRNEAESLYQNATGLKQEAGLMAGRLEHTELEFDELLAQTANNETLINEAKDKVQSKLI